MPIFEFICPECNEYLEALCFPGEKIGNCPYCQEEGKEVELERIPSAPTFKIN